MSFVGHSAKALPSARKALGKEKLSDGASRRLRLLCRAPHGGTPQSPLSLPSVTRTTLGKGGRFAEFLFGDTRQRQGGFAECLTCSTRQRKRGLMLLHRKASIRCLLLMSCSMNWVMPDGFPSLIFVLGFTKFCSSPVKSSKLPFRRTSDSLSSK